MAEYTPEQFREAAKRAADGGDLASAKKLIARGKAVEQESIGLRETVADMADAAGSGIVRGATALGDFPGKAMQGAVDLAEWVFGGATGKETPETFDMIRKGLEFGPLGSGTTFKDAQETVAPGADDYDPKTRAGEYASTVGEFAPSALMFGGTGGLLPLAVAPGMASEFVGKAVSDADLRFPPETPLVGGKPVEPFARTGAAILAPSAYNVASNLAKKAVTPLPSDPVRAKAVQTLKKEGVGLTAGQATGSKNLMYREDVMPRTQGVVETQKRQFTKAVLKRIGVEGERAEPVVLKKAADRIGGMFDDLASRNDITVDQRLIDAARDTLKTYGEMTSKTTTVPLVRGVVQDIFEIGRSGKPITGAKYQQLRTDLGPALKASDGALRNAAHSLRGALDGALERSLAAAGKADELAVYHAARRQYKDLLAIEKSMAAAGEDTALGLLNPRQLRMAVVQQGRPAYVRGQSDLGDLARAGNATMSPLPQSGTQPRFGAHAVQALQGSGTGTGIGLLTYGLTKDPTLAAMMGLGGSTLPLARNAAVASRPGQAWLANQLLPGRSGVIEPLTLSLAPVLAEQERRRQDRKDQ